MSKHWYNNGIKQVFVEFPPDETFKQGMLQSSKDKMRRQFSEEHKCNLSKAAKNRTIEAQQNINNSLKGRVASNKGKSSWCAGKTKDNDPRIKVRAESLSATLKEKPSPGNKGKKFTEEHKRKIGLANSGKKGPLPPEEAARRVAKANDTKKKNKTFNTSSSEKLLYESLKETYSGKTILKQYKDNIRYPFYCDFYIVEEDLFIELNAHWTHGSRPYDPEDNFCQYQLRCWEEKAKTSQFYAAAIETWTVRDVKKAKVAKENNLNYLVIY